MKKLILLAVVCIPMALMAQTRTGTTSNPRAQGSTLGFEPTLVVEVSVKTVGGRTTAKVLLGTDPETKFSKDKYMTMSIESLQREAFASTTDAINALTQIGFEVKGSYLLGPNESRIILTKRGIEGKKMKKGDNPDAEKKGAGNGGVEIGTGKTSKSKKKK